MDLIKILLESCELLETDEYNRYEEELTDGKDIDEKNRIENKDLSANADRSIFILILS